VELPRHTTPVAIGWLKFELEEELPCPPQEAGRRIGNTLPAVRNSGRRGTPARCTYPTEAYVMHEPLRRDSATTNSRIFDRIKRDLRFMRRAPLAWRCA